MFLILIQLLALLYAEVTVTEPSKETLDSYYISAASVGSSCDSGLTISWYTTASYSGNQILVTSSARNAGSTPVCYKYGGKYYGSGCPACVTSSTTTFPSYPGSVTLFIPHIAMVDDGELSSLTSFTLYVGVDCATGSSSCADNDLEDDTDVKTTITVYVDNTAPTGYVDSFKIQRGDGSIYIIAFDTSAISDSGSGLYQARFYYSTCDTEPDKTSISKTFQTNESMPWVIDGLENGTSYTLRATVLDKSGNEYDTDDFVLSSSGSIAIPVNIEDETSSCVIPTEITGFLNGDERCFIATALFGAKSNQVLYFRSFRDKYLLSTKAGSLFVRTYYKTSPALVKSFKDNPLVKLILKTNLELVYRGLKLCDF